MENAVPATLARRSLADRYSTYVDEVDRLVAAGREVMRRTGSIDPRVSDIVEAAGLSNQAFYRHFRSKEELLVAVLDDGLHQLVGYLEHQMAKERSPLRRVRRWIEGVLAQAADPDAAEATRPFVLNRMRLVDRFPDEVRRSDQLLQQPLVEALTEAVATGELAWSDPRRDADAICRLAMGTMHDLVVRGERPPRRDVTHLVTFVGAALEGARG